MRWTVTLSFFSFFSGLKVQASSVQKDGLTLPDSVTNYRDAVKDIFQTSYTAYKWISSSPALDVLIDRIVIEHTLGGMMILLLRTSRITTVGTDGVLPSSMQWVLWYVTKTPTVFVIFIRYIVCDGPGCRNFLLLRISYIKQTNRTF